MLHGFVFSLPVAAVALVVYALGAAPGVAFAAIVGLGFWYFFKEPFRTHQEVARLAAFFAASASIVVAIGQLHRTRRRLRSEEAKAGRAEQEVRRSNALLRAIADTTPDLIFVKDRDSRMLLANPAMLRAIGKSEAAVIGRNDLELLGEETGRTIVENDRRIMQSGVPEVLEEVLHAGRERRVYLSTKSPYRDESGEVIGLIGVSLDITDRKRAEEALRETDRRKDEFLGVLSHELRNPLGPIRNALWLLDRAVPGGEDAARAKAVVDRQVAHLARIVDDLLDITRISRGKIRLQPSRLELGDVIRRTVDDHRPLFASRDIAVEVRLGETPVWLDADPTRMSQVIGNLLQNAVKFTERGGHVEVALERLAGSAIVRVRDDGVGIAPEMLARMFQPFTQADDSLHRSRGGLGLGLALVKGLVELHGGAVEARSGGPGSGAELVVRLPLAPEKPILQGGPPTRAAPMRSLRVLIVEDNVDAAETLRELLLMWGHEVEVAHDGAAGVELARAFRPEILLCDIGLPVMDGYEVARAIRADPALASTFLVAVTGYALPEDQRRAAEAGFSRHLAKPVAVETIEELLATAPHLASA